MGTNWKYPLIAAAASLFLQMLHWVIYEWTGFPAVLLCITPLFLCAVYHIMQSDSTENRRMTRKQFFLGAVLVPLVLGVGFSLVCFVRHPDMAIYHSGASGAIQGVRSIAALFAGRVVLTSLYLLVFSVIDIPLQHLQQSRRAVHATGGQE